MNIEFKSGKTYHCDGSSSGCTSYCQALTNGECRSLTYHQMYDIFYAECGDLWRDEFPKSLVPHSNILILQDELDLAVRGENYELADIIKLNIDHIINNLCEHPF